MSVRGVGDLEEATLKGTALRFHLWLSCKLLVRASHSWDKLYSDIDGKNHTYICLFPSILNGSLPHSTINSYLVHYPYKPKSLISKLTPHFFSLSVWKVVLRWAECPQICGKAFEYWAAFTKILLLSLGEQIAPEATALGHSISHRLHTIEQCFIINIEVLLQYLGLISGISFLS